MRPQRRRAAVVAAANVTRPISPSPVSSEEDELDEMQSSSSDLEEMDTGENEVFSEEEDEIEDDDQPLEDNVLDNDDDMESLSEQELDEDEEDQEQEEEEEEEEEADGLEEEEEEQMPNRSKPAARSNNKRKKPAIEENSDEEDFSDDAEVLRNRPMTKRQRAKVYQEIPEEYLELPMDTGKKKQLSLEEEQLKKSEVARRRKNQSIQRAEKDKADTINRLLKKQASKSKRIIEDNTEDKETAHEKLMKSEDPNRLRYISTAQGSQLNIPSVYSIEQIFGDNMKSASTQPKLQKKCEANGCSNHRKYTAKKSGKSVCSLEHYKVVEAQ